MIQPAGDTFNIEFEGSGAILTPEGYRTARRAVETFNALPRSWDRQPYLWISDCGGSFSDLEAATEAELLALGVDPHRFFQSDKTPEADPCRAGAPPPQGVLVGVREWPSGPWLSHHDMRGVYFDQGSSDIRSDWLPVVRRARAYVTDESYVEIIGNTDTAEADAEHLSLARAQAYRDAFVRLGVPDWQMRVQGAADARLARPTAEDVSEPLNRRIEVVIRQVNAEGRTPAWWFDQRDAALAR